MSDQSTSAPSGNPQRRMSISAIFAPLSNNPSTNASSPPSAGVPATPDAAQHRRGMSISALGLGNTSNGQPTAYNAFARQRRASISTSSAASSPEFRNSFSDDNAVIEEDDKGYGGPPSPSFARRTSFGAQALRDVRQGSVAGAPNRGRRPSSQLYSLSEDHDHPISNTRRSIETARAPGEGFNWSEALRDRSMRSPSFSASNPFAKDMNRTRSTGTVATVPEPPKEMPKATPTPPRLKKPDHMGERMLRGDFMMD